MRVTISAGGDIGEAEGTISYIRPLVGEETRTALARIVLSNSKGNWRPGLFITGKIAVDNLTVPLLIPKTALQSMEDKTVVFVKSHEGFEARPVTIGQTSETMAEVTSGLTAGEQYIAKGAFTVKAQMSKDGFESGHSH